MTQKGFAPVKVGVVGLGRFGRLHALTLARLAEADLVALVARRQASLDALAAELPGVPGWTDLGQAVAEFNRYNRVQLTVTDPELAGKPVSGVFNAAEPEAFIAFLQSVTPVEIVRDGDRRITIGPARAH